MSELHADSESSAELTKQKLTNFKQLLKTDQPVKTIKRATRLYQNEASNLLQTVISLVIPTVFYTKIYSSS